MTHTQQSLKYKLGGELEIDRLGYGGMQLTGTGVFGDAPDRPNAIKVLQQAVATGVNFIDTAEAYGPKTNETLIADALFPYKKGEFISTKGSFNLPAPGPWNPNAAPPFMKDTIEHTRR